MAGVLKAIWDTWKVIGSILGILTAVIAVATYLNLKIEIAEILTLFALAGIFLCVYYTAKRIDEGICMHPGTLADGGSKKKEEAKTSGGGAFAGMIAGGALGLPFGPVGVVIGGLIGALLGNEVERKSETKRLE